MPTVMYVPRTDVVKETAECKRKTGGHLLYKQLDILRLIWAD